MVTFNEFKTSYEKLQLKFSDDQLHTLRTIYFGDTDVFAMDVFLQDLEKTRIEQKSKIDRHDKDDIDASDDVVDDFLLYKYFAIQPLSDKKQHIAFDPVTEQLKLRSGQKNGHCVFWTPQSSETGNNNFSLINFTNDPKKRVLRIKSHGMSGSHFQFEP